MLCVTRVSVACEVSSTASLVGGGEALATFVLGSRGCTPTMQLPGAISTVCATGCPLASVARRLACATRASSSCSLQSFRCSASSRSRAANGNIASGAAQSDALVVDVVIPASCGRCMSPAVAVASSTSSRRGAAGDGMHAPTPSRTGTTERTL